MPCHIFNLTMSVKASAISARLQNAVGIVDQSNAWTVISSSRNGSERGMVTYGPAAKMLSPGNKIRSDPLSLLIAVFLWPTPRITTALQ